MTQSTVEPRCRWCGRRFDPSVGPGRPRQYCRQGCRQQAHLARKQAAAHGLGPDDVIVQRVSLDELMDGLYCLQAAIEDVDRDLAESQTAQDVAEALAWILQNARPLQALWVST